MREGFRLLWRVAEIFDTLRGYWTLVPWPVRWTIWLGVSKLLPSAVITWVLQAANIIAENAVVSGIVFMALALSFLAFFKAVPIRIPYPLTKPQTESRIERHGVSLAALLRWKDSVGRPIVTVHEGRVASIWAALDIEVRNLEPEPKRMSELVLEVRKASAPKSLVGVAEPAARDGNVDWYKRKHPRRVDWLLPSVSEAITHHVRFAYDFGLDNPDAPEDPRQFEAAIIADLGTKRRRIRLPLGDDIFTEQGMAAAS